jgi:hypothetical protein
MKSQNRLFSICVLSRSPFPLSNDKLSERSFIGCWALFFGLNKNQAE